MEKFIKYCREHGGGTIVEFGTLTGTSTKFIADNWNDKIVTIDGWKGLPKSEKELPHTGIWNEGAYTGNKEEVQALLSPYKNVLMIDSWINKLEDPSVYNIGIVVGANIDVDIYESTMDSLLWLSRCDWLNDEVIIRFDDWDHPCDGDSEMRKQVSLHNQLAYSDFLKSSVYQSTLLSVDNYFAHFKLKRK